MSLSPSFGAGSSPMKAYPLLPQFRLALCGGLAKTMIYFAGCRLTVSTRRAPPAMMRSSLTGFASNGGLGGGQLAGSRPSSARNRLSLTYSSCPRSARYLRPRRFCVRSCRAARCHA